MQVNCVGLALPKAGSARTEVATYALRIKDKTKGSPTRPRAASAKAKPSPAKAQEQAAAPATPAPRASAQSDSGELERLRAELQRVNHELSRIGRVTRPGVDPMKQMHLPEKQELLSEKLDLERKIRTLSRS